MTVDDAGGVLGGGADPGGGVDLAERGGSVPCSETNVLDERTLAQHIGFSA